MKSIKIFSLLAAAALLAGCAKEQTTVSRLALVSADTDLSSAGGTGTVMVNKPVSKVYTKADWLTVSAGAVQGQVLATVFANTSRESRHASVVIKSSDTDSLVVSFSQGGIYYDSSAIENLGFSFSEQLDTISIITAETVNIIEKPDWAELSLVKEKGFVTGIQLKIAENTTGVNRAEWVKWSVCDCRDSICVSQLDPDTIIGDFWWIGDDDGYKAQMYTSVSEESIYVWDEDWDIPVVFNPEDLTMTVENLSPLGGFPGWYYAITFCVGDGFDVYSHSTARFKFCYDLNLDTIVATLKDFSGIGIGVFGQPERDPDSYIGYQNRYKELQLQQI